MTTLSQRLGAEFIGSAFLLATVVGFGVMADRLAGGNVAIALLGNTIPTGAILVVLITMLGPISGAHFNPAVTIARGFSDTFAGIRPTDVSAFVLAQCVGAAIAVAVCSWLLAERKAGAEVAGDAAT